MKQGKSQNVVDYSMDFQRSIISRELKRNTLKRGRRAKEYNPARAQMKTENRHHEN